MTHGDYKLINEVFMDNFEEAESLMGPLVVPNPTKIDTTDASGPSSELSTCDTSASEGVKLDKLDRTISWGFVLKRIEMELFSGTSEPVRVIPYSCFTMTRASIRTCPHETASTSVIDALFELVTRPSFH